MIHKFGLFISERGGYLHQGYCSIGLVVRRHSCYSNSTSGQRTAVTEGRGCGKARQSERGKTEWGVHDVKYSAPQRERAADSLRLRT